MKRTHVHSDKPNAPADLEIDEGVEEAPPPTAKQLAAVIELSREQIRLQRKVDNLTADLKVAKSKLNDNMTLDLPKAMDEAGIKATPLGNGAHVEIETIVTASIPSPNSEKAENAAERNRIGIEWCNQHCPDLVKYLVKAFFTRDEYKLFQKFKRDMAKRKIQIPFEVEATVHSGTLGKWVRGQDALSKAVDEEALGVHRIRIAEVQLPKEKKSKDKV